MNSQLPTQTRIAAEEAISGLRSKMDRNDNPLVFSSHSFMSAVQWHHGYLLKSAPEAGKENLIEAATILLEYSRPKSMIDNGNLFFAAVEYQNECQYQAAQIAVLQSEVQRLREQLAKAEAILEHDRVKQYFTDKKGGA